jgi:hypothetical protein
MREGNADALEGLIRGAADARANWTLGGKNGGSNGGGSGGPTRY